jgi:hypothetical protein
MLKGRRAIMGSASIDGIEFVYVFYSTRDGIQVLAHTR